MIKAMTLPDRDETIRLSFFDTAGEEKYHAITACHYRKAMGALLVYDVTSRKSFEHIAKWL
jgi:GTPase SAR1 family protein